MPYQETAAHFTLVLAALVLRLFPAAPCPCPCWACPIGEVTEYRVLSSEGVWMK